jgi:hypothetical protein
MDSSEVAHGVSIVDDSLFNSTRCRRRIHHNQFEEGLTSTLCVTALPWRKGFGRVSGLKEYLWD